MPKCFWSYNYRLITTVQQHENLLLVVASQVDQLWQHVVTCLHASANYCGSVPQEQRWQADRRLFLACNGSSNFKRCIVVVSRMIFYFVSISHFMSDEEWVFMVPSHKTKTETETRGSQDQDQYQDAEIQDQDWDQDLWKKVSIRLETKTQVSRTSSLVYTKVMAVICSLRTHSLTDSNPQTSWNPRTDVCW